MTIILPEKQSDEGWEEVQDAWKCKQVSDPMM